MKLKPSLERIVIAFIVLLCLAFIGGETYRAIEQRNDAIEDAKIATTNLAKAAAQHAWDTFRSAEAVVAGITDRLEVDGISPAKLQQMHVSLMRLHVNQPMLQSVNVYDADGWMIASSDSGPLGRFHVVDREYFIYQRDHHENVARISRALTSRVNGRWVIPVVRRYDHADGSFAGVVVASVTLDYFNNFYTTFDIGKQGNIALFMNDGIELLRHPFQASAVNIDLSSQPLFSVYLPKAPTGEIKTTSRIDGIHRYTSYRRVLKYPLVVVASLSRDEVLAPWRTAMGHRLALDGFLMGIIAIMGVYLIRQARQAAASEARLAHVLTAADLATWRLDFARGRWEVNDKYLDLLGMKRADFNPDIESRWQLVHPDDIERTRLAFADAVADNRRLYDVELRLKRTGGGWRWVQARGAVIEWNAEHQPAVASGILVDISERRQIMADLEDARDAANEASRVKSEFLATMSHEIRTPMSGVIGFADFLLESDLDEKQRRNAMLLKQAGNSLLAVINDILDVSKIEAGKLELENVPMNLAALADGALSIMRPAAQAKQLDMVLDIDADLPGWVLGDPTRTRQVMFNLLNNAIKFTEAGSITLSARLEAGGMARFEVRDTGIGIPEDKRDRLFQTFSQVDSTTSRRYGGTGLGLAICKHLAEAMGGGAGVESEVDVGSTFWFTILLHPTEAPEPQGQGPGSEPTRLGRILVAEDMIINQIIVDELLRKQGHEVVIVANGAEAVEAVQGSHFDMVLMDMQMPGMDGLEATKLIRALDGPVRGIPIIALTANALAAEVTACRAAGMDDHLSKPIDYEKLMDAIGTYMALDRQAS